MFKAIEKNDLALVKRLLDKKADVNQKNSEGSTPLISVSVEKHMMFINQKTMSSNIHVCRHGSKVLEIAELLLEHGARVNEVGGRFQEAALHHACLYGNLDLVKLLLKNKADINIKNEHGWTPLHNTIGTENRFEITKFLVNNGADINERTNEGATPFASACSNNNLKIAQFLLDNKANVDDKCNLGDTPLQAACQNNNFDMIKFLVNNGADVYEKFDGKYFPAQMVENKECGVFLIMKMSETKTEKEIISLLTENPY